VSTAGYVKLLLPPRQSRGNSHFGLATRTKSGSRGREKWERDYRSPRLLDDNTEAIRARMDDKFPEWLALDCIPTESIGELSNYDRGHRMYGMSKWQDMFSPRQLLCHGTAVEVFNEMYTKREKSGQLNEATKAGFVYLAIAIDKVLNWKCSSGNLECQSSRHAICV
jgi:putative DNA methylase